MIPSPGPRERSSPTRRSRPITERAIAYCDRVVELFSAAADPAAAERMSAYMRGLFPFYGITSVVRRELQRRAGEGLPRPNEAELGAIARRLWGEAERECQYAACDHLRRHVKVLGPDFLPTAGWLISTKSWWDTVDALASAVVGPIVATSPGSRAVVDGWLESSDMWLVRAAILHQLRYRAGTDADWLFAACIRRSGSPEFFVRKAIGWALREYAKVAPERVRVFVDDHRDALAPLSVREATKHLT